MTGYLVRHEEFESASEHMEGAIQFEVLHDLPFAPEVIWPALSNTDWMNRALGLPAVRYEFTANPEGGSTTHARTRLAG
ncbi:MAG: hypothetical protein WCE49_19180, partial [Terrimicrobiaceae bacterium]